MSAGHAHGVSGVAVASDGRGADRGSVVALLVLVIGLAAATVWLVALPLLDRPARAEPSCEVFVLRSGATKCVPILKPGSPAAKKPKPKSSRRAKR
ncbi:MAG: hypothetical protein ABWY51_08080 [Gaiellaceae bacterium]